MPIIIDYSFKFKAAAESYKIFKTVYGLVKRSELNNHPFGEITTNFVKEVVHNAFEIHPDIRETFPGLNAELKEMYNKGYLKLSEDEITPFDSLTKEIYFNDFFKDKNS